MSEPDSPEDPQSAHPLNASDPQRSPPSEQEDGAGDERYFLIAEKFVGTAMMFVGFLNVLLSISGGYEINIVPLILYCAGLFIWSHAVIVNPTTRYTVMGLALILGLGIFHFGEVLFWHKQAFFWGTVILVMFFMFKPDKR